jgi:RHS repeat-associated protein
MTRQNYLLCQKLFVIIGFLIFGQNNFAQPASISPDRGFSPGRSYAISDIETISMQSGNVMFNVPLGSLPAGRGGISGGVNLLYNSKLWDMALAEIQESSGTHTIYDKNTLFFSKDGGWRYGYKYRLEYDLRRGGFEDTSYCVGEINIVRNKIVMPDGSSHFLFISGSTLAMGESDLQDYSEIYADGRNGCTTSAVTSGQTITLFSTDSSFLRIEVATDNDTNLENNTWTMYLPDGTRVVNNPQSGVSQRIIDRNGNYIEVIENAVDSNYSNHRTTYLQDQLGRKLAIEYEAATDEDWIHSVGVGGAGVVTKVQWKNIQINKTYRASDYAGPPPLNNLNFPLNKTMAVVDKIYLPEQIDGDLFYEFQYNADSTSSADAGWGEISEVKMPSGATSAYEYVLDNESGSTVYTEEVLENRPDKKTLIYDLEYDGSTTSANDVWLYEFTKGLASSSKITAPDGGVTTEYYGTTVQTPSAPTPPNFLKGDIYKTELPNGTVIEKWYGNNSPGPHNYSTAVNTLYQANRFVKYEFTSIRDANGTLTKTAIKEFVRDKNGNTTEVKEYDFATYANVPRNSEGRPNGLPSGATPARISKTEYYNPVPDSSSTTYTDADSYWLTSSPRLLNLAKSAEIQDGSATPVSRSEFIYDYTNYDSSNTKAGNPTETKTWDSFKGGTARSYSNPLTGTNAITTLATYNSYGMPLTSTDANGNVTSITYGNVSGPGGNVTDLYPTQTVAAYGTGIARTSTAVYDYYTGVTTSTTDEDNDLTNATEYDDLGRPEKSITADGDALESWTVTQYDDLARRVVVKSDLETVGDGKKVAIQHFDQLGRVRLSRSLENAATESATNEQHGIKVQTRYATTYSSPNGYTYSLTSNPYRAATSSAASSDPTMGWTRSKAHHLGRHAETETFSGAALPAPWASNTTSTGMVQTDIDANATTVTDQAGKVRRSITNGLGQLIRVDEPTGSGLGTVGSPNQATSYAYDTLNNLTTVTQGSQTRTFTYSTMSRLLSAANPESGTISYVYDSNGNLTTKTDARSIVTTYTYDALNRVTDRDYTGSTPDVDYTYGAVAPKIGKLTKVQSSVSATEYLTFDILGRVTSHKQTTDSVDYTTGYTYNLSGALIEESYPSGRVVKNTIDTADGSLSQVQSKRSSDTYRNYANSFTYNAAGAVSSMKLGNNRWETTQFNSRLQSTQIGLGSGATSLNLLKLDYSYGTTANNGNVLSQTITVPGMAHTLNQTYTYDELNRISNAEETYNSTQTWEQTFTYDRYGNRNFDEANTTTLPKNCGTTPNFTVCVADKKIVNPAVNTSNNRLSTSDDYDFDSSGNTTEDAEGRTFVYDAENKQIEVIDNSVTVGEYFYDGDGKRIKKIVPATGETTIFVYDAAGKQVAEYSTIVQTGGNAKTVYTTNDHLGSPRINTDGVGAVVARHDYHPFGEEIATAQRTGGVGYADDTIRKKFTGYERDKETDLDFAKTRYFSYGGGRFGTPDSFTSATHASNPQSWNLYSYVQNRPLTLVDPDGRKGRISWYTDSDGVIHVSLSATFALYGANGQNVSKKDLKTYKEAMLKGIQKRLSGEFNVEGKKFEISANISIEIKSSEAKAMTSGADNIIEIGTQNLVRNGAVQGGVGFGVESESFDRMVVGVREDPGNYRGSGDPITHAGDVAAHEFAAHLLDVFHSEDPKSLFYGDDTSGQKFLQSDFERMFFGREGSYVQPPPPPGGQPRTPLPPLTQGLASSGSDARMATHRNFEKPSDVYAWQYRMRQMQ